MNAEALPTLYIFLDEGGNFDFSRSGTRFFTLTCVSLYRPFRLHTALDTYKYNLIEHRIKPRIEMEYFHCANDNRHVRSKVFEMLGQEVPPESVDAVIVEKCKTGPALQAPEKFYPKMLGYLLRFAIEKAAHGLGEVVVITDSLPVAGKRKAIEKAIKNDSCRDAARSHPLPRHAPCIERTLWLADCRLLQLGDLSEMGARRP